MAQSLAAPTEPSLPNTDLTGTYTDPKSTKAPPKQSQLV